MNRNEVLHGTDLRYATKANSLRALLLVDYLAAIKEMLDNKKAQVAKWRKGIEAKGCTLVE